MNREDPRAKKLSYSLHGLQQAILRVQNADRQRLQDAFVAASEAVSWAVALDNVLLRNGYRALTASRYKDASAESDEGKTVRGMRFAGRNVLHASELIDFFTPPSVVGSSQLGSKSGWVWTPLSELGALDPRRADEKGFYESHVGGRGVLDTLLDANRWFTGLTPPLPALARDPTAMQKPRLDG